MRGKKFLPADDSLDGIITYLTEQCGGNVHDRGVVAVTSYYPWSLRPQHAAKNVVDLKANTVFWSEYRDQSEDIPHEPANWICYGFKRNTIVPTHYSVRPNWNRCVGWNNLKSWAVEISKDGTTWTQIDHHEGSSDLNDKNATQTFAVTATAAGKHIKLVNIGRNHWEGVGDDCLNISSWEIFGTLAG
jgi:hypothetical protein